MKKKERAARRAEQGYTTATNRIAKQIEAMTGFETRVCVPGHMQRGGTPSPYDRVLATQFGAYAAKMVEDENYGITVAMKNNHVWANKLSDIRISIGPRGPRYAGGGPAAWASAWGEGPMRARAPGTL